MTVDDIWRRANIFVNIFRGYVIYEPLEPPNVPRRVLTLAKLARQHMTLHFYEARVMRMG